MRKTVSYRKLKDIDIAAVKLSIDQSTNLCAQNGPIDDILSSYTSGIRDIIDLHAPLCHKTIILRPHSPWYTDELHIAKKGRRSELG